MRDAQIEVSGLTLTRGATRLGPITFTLHQPGCYWLTGVSGAGKSLLLESLAGFHTEARGRVRVNEKEVGTLAPEHRGITLMPQRWRLFPHWDVARNLRFAARLSATPLKRIHQLAEQLHILPMIDRSVRGLSGGETQRIALIQTLLSPAQILLLDEPFSAIDATLQSIVLDLLQREAAESSRIILTAAHQPPTQLPTQATLRIEDGHLIEAGFLLASKFGTLGPND